MPPSATVCVRRLQPFQEICNAPASVWASIASINLNLRDTTCIQVSVMKSELNNVAGHLSDHMPCKLMRIARTYEFLYVSRFQCNIGLRDALVLPSGVPSLLHPTFKAIIRLEKHAHPYAGVERSRETFPMKLLCIYCNDRHRDRPSLSTSQRKRQFSYFK